MFKLEMKNFNKKGQVTAAFEQIFTDLTLLKHTLEQNSGVFTNYRITKDTTVIAANYKGE